jgi:hypothetical protein
MTLLICVTQKVEFMEMKMAVAEMMLNDTQFHQASKRL